jgi:transposase-like protein
MVSIGKTYRIQDALNKLRSEVPPEEAAAANDLDVDFLFRVRAALEEYSMGGRISSICRKYVLRDNDLSKIAVLRGLQTPTEAHDVRMQQAIDEALTTGRTMVDICAKNRVHDCTLRTRLAELGVSTRDRLVDKIVPVNFQAERNAAVVKRFREIRAELGGARGAAAILARELGMTRQRINQIVDASGER